MDRASGVWTVRGVTPEARKHAKAAAAAKGWTLGTWVEEAIYRSVRLQETEEPGKKSPESDKRGALHATPGGTEITDYFLAQETERIPSNPAGKQEKPGPTIREVVSGEVLDKNGVNVAVVEPEAEPIRAHGRKSRVVCQHGIEKGWNCWQCGGLAAVK